MRALPFIFVRRKSVDEVDDRLFTVRVLDRPRPTAGAARATRASVVKPTARAKNGRAASGNDVVAPMHGVVVEVMVAAGDAVIENQVVAVIEAMKMMNEIRTHRAGTIATVHAEPGATLETSAPIVSLA